MNKSPLAKSYSSKSSELSRLIWATSAGDRAAKVAPDTVTLCCVKGTAKSRLNVSSNTYWDICRRNVWSEWNKQGLFLSSIVLIRQRQAPLRNDIWLIDFESPHVTRGHKLCTRIFFKFAYEFVRRVFYYFDKSPHVSVAPV